MRRLILLIIIATIISSCAENPSEKPIKQLDSLINIINDAQKQLKTISPNVHEPILDTIQQDISFIQNYYPDTLDLQTALKIDYYSRNLKSASKYSSTFNSQNSELEYTISQLSNIKTDINNNILDLSSFNEIYPSEEKAVIRHKESVENLTVWYESITSSYNYNKPSIDSIITYIKVRTDR